MKLLTSRNTGVRDSVRSTDWRAGGESGIAFESVIPNGDWSPYIGQGEHQSDPQFDTKACVSFSALNSIETQINRLILTGTILPQTLVGLKDLGFIKDGVFNASDRFIAKLSGTTTQGNWAWNVWDTIRTQGLVPESDWSFTPEMDWNEYYADISLTLIAKAKKFLELFKVNYEFVYLNDGQDTFSSVLKQHLHQAPLQILTPVCQPWTRDDPITTCGSRASQHATMLYNYRDNAWWNIQDQYEPYLKRLSWGYAILTAIKGVVNQTGNSLQEFHWTFLKDLSFGQTGTDIKALQNALKILGFFPKTIQSTGYYGLITKKAVSKFQWAYSVASAPILWWNGGRLVGQATREKLNSLFI